MTTQEEKSKEEFDHLEAMSDQAGKACLVDNLHVVPGRYWHTVSESGQKKIFCDLCPRACVLKQGDRGFCFVRQNIDGKMYLTTYGKSTGFCVDPIEKKPLNHFLPGSSVLSFGTAGCNLGCRFCQNWDISKSREIERLSQKATAEDIAIAARNLGCRSVAFTYNDPVIWMEYALDTARACHQIGLKTVAVTAGFITPQARPEFFSLIDAANVDLKAFTERFYKKLTLSALSPVLDTLKWLKHESDVWFEITNLIIPEENDSSEELKAMCNWIVENLGDDVPIHFTAFHPDYKLMHKDNTPSATLMRARDIALRAGISYVYTGNVHDKKSQSTYCHGCKQLLIERDWYDLGKYRIENQRCSKCKTVIPGHFEDQKGDWGGKRLPVSFGGPCEP